MKSNNVYTRSDLCTVYHPAVKYAESEYYITAFKVQKLTGLYGPMAMDPTFLGYHIFYYKHQPQLKRTVSAVKTSADMDDVNETNVEDVLESLRNDDSSLTVLTLNNIVSVI